MQHPAEGTLVVHLRRRLGIGQPVDRASDRVIVVLGYRQIGDDGSHGISAICRAGVRRGESLAGETTPRAVIFTGWSSNGGPTEADQMAAEWNGRRDVDLICEPRAANTAENAVRSLQLLATIEGGSEVIAVCSIYHYPASASSSTDSASDMATPSATATSRRRSPRRG